MVSPLVQVNAAVTRHEPKVLGIYHQLFAQTHDPGYWVEFFVLPVNRAALNRVLASVPAGEYVAKYVIVRTLVAAAVSNIVSGDAYVRGNALAILGHVLRHIFLLRLSASDTILVLAAVDRIHEVFTRVTDVLPQALEHAQTSTSALEFLELAATASYGTSFTGYFTQKGLFSPLIRLVASDALGARAFTAVGVLALLCKTMDQTNAFDQRLVDFVDEQLSEKMTGQAEGPLDKCLRGYTLGRPTKSWFSWVTSSSSEEKMDDKQLPLTSAVLLLPLFAFCSYNDLFSALVIKSPVFPIIAELCTYAVQSPARGSRAHAYTVLILLMYKKMVTYPQLMELLTDTSNKAVIMVCQNRAPLLSFETGPRIRLAGILDVVQAAIRYNVRSSVDRAIYGLSLEILFWVVSSLRALRECVDYNWSGLWRTLLSLLKRASKDDFKEAAFVTALIAHVIAFCLLHQFLFSPEHYQNLFTSVMENGALFEQMASRYAIANTPFMTLLLAMSSHYQLLLSNNRPFGLEMVSEVTKQGSHALALFERTRAGKEAPLLTEAPRVSGFIDELTLLKGGLQKYFEDAVKFSCPTGYRMPV